MWDAIRETRDTEGRPVATLVSVVSEDERHTKGHTRRREPRVRLTVLEDIPGLNMRPVQPIEPELEGIVPRTVHAMPGDELIVSLSRATRLESSGKAIRVNTSKMGKGQKRLLGALLELARERNMATAKAAGWFGAKAILVASIGRVLGGDWRSPGATEYVGVETEGDVLRRVVCIRIPWVTAEVAGRSDKRVSKSALAQSLRHLERRGLVLRDVRWGEPGRTGSVELTTAGWRVAEELTAER